MRVGGKGLTGVGSHITGAVVQYLGNSPHTGTLRKARPKALPNYKKKKEKTGPSQIKPTATRSPFGVGSKLFLVCLLCFAVSILTPSALYFWTV